jgi:anaerobic magnesium-protoporphyrin IX monomethyl ester cyclase
VLVGQSYYLRFDPKLWDAMQPYAPLGSMYAAAELRAHGHDVAFFDAMLASSEDEWGHAIARRRPDVAVIFEDNFNYLSKMCLLRMRTAALRMLELARDAGCVAIVCGSDATDHPEQYLDHGADFVVVGEGEETLTQLLEHVGCAPLQDPTELCGLVFRDADSALVSTGRRPNLKDLDAIPFPAWDLIDVERYRRAWAPHGHFSMNMVTTRGCPFHCNWCAKPIWGQRYNVRSPENVVDELEWLRGAYSPDHISFADDIFGLRPGWLRDYADLVRSRDAVVPFKCLSRADLLLRDGEIAALRDAGCETVWVGAESGAQQVLDAMDKGTRVDQIVESARRLHEAGIRVGFFLQFGYPGEGADEIEATRRLVREAGPDDIGISVSYPLPGTRFYERVRADLGDKQNWVSSDDLSMLYRGPYSTDFYRQLHQVVHKEFRLRKAAGTRMPAQHVANAARGVTSRERLGLARDAVTLPLDEFVLQRMERRERRARRERRDAPDLVTIADAFSSTAARYDAFGDDHPHLTRMRRKVYATVEGHVARGARVLELNAGTGTDAVELAQRGYRVHATDIASGMLARIRDKVAAHGLQDSVTVQDCSFLELERVEGAPYDAVLSNLGGLNCVADVGAVLHGLDRVLAPGGIAVLVVMPPICLWELALVFTGDFGLATRRLRRGGTRAHLEGREFTVHYFTPRQLRGALEPDYDLLSVHGLSVFTPTAESKNLAKRHPALYAQLARLDDRLSPLAPFRGWGDFFVAVARRRENERA